MNVYDFDVVNGDGSKVSLNDYNDKVLLIVNTASKCGFTYQYEGMEELQKEYSDKGFSFLAFPCNQFGAQEPGSDEEIASFCQVNYNHSFPLFKKVDVNGSDSEPLFDHLKEKAPGLLGSKAIKWNFTKFLVGKDGVVIKRYAPQDKPESLKGDIEKAIG
jgi:glutathione peroxidase